MKDKGYVKTHRSIMDWEWYKVPNTNILFRHCILRANFEDTKWRGIEVKRGSFITSLNTLSQETGLTVQNVRTAEKNLKLTNDLTIKSHNKYRIVTVNNYCEYQATNKQDNKELTSNQQSANKQLTTDKELKEPKSLKNVIKNTYGEFVLLSSDQYVKLIKDYNKISVDEMIVTLNNYIGQIGEVKAKKYKSHNHTIRNWLNKDLKKKPKSNEPDWLDDYKNERDEKDIKTEQDDKKKMDSISLEEVSKRFNKL